MMKLVSALAGVGVVAAAAAFTQTHGGHGGHSGHAQPAVGVPKSLTSAQVADLRAGRGMGLAKSAELGGYPGPRHVLDNAAVLGLSAAQKARTRHLFDAMAAEAVLLGERLIAQEAALDRLFTSRAASEAKVAAATRAIGETSVRLRMAHLRTHLTMTQVLTPAQIGRYAAIRGAAR